MDNKLRKLFEFLEKNREHNHAIQEQFYASSINQYKCASDKILLLLYNVSKTQSRPNIDKLAESFKGFIEHAEALKSFGAFTDYVNNGENNKINYKSLFYGMKSQKGWGDKTSALFVKSIFHVHNGEYPDSLKIWSDAPKTIENDDKLYIPVDIVITSIFEKLSSSEKWNFNNINKKIEEISCGKEVEIWDDLWFWGFVTQKSVEDKKVDQGEETGKRNTGERKRVFEWNENKYWMMQYTHMKKNDIDSIKGKAKEFLCILNR